METKEDMIHIKEEEEAAPREKNRLGPSPLSSPTMETKWPGLNMLKGNGTLYIIMLNMFRSVMQQDKGTFLIGPYLNERVRAHYLTPCTSNTQTITLHFVQNISSAIHRSCVKLNFLSLLITALYCKIQNIS